jgi:hypothetical protein
VLTESVLLGPVRFVLYVLQNLTRGLQGVINLAVFLSNKKVVDELRKVRWTSPQCRRFGSKNNSTLCATFTLEQAVANWLPCGVRLAGMIRASSMSSAHKNSEILAKEDSGRPAKEASNFSVHNPIEQGVTIELQEGDQTAVRAQSVEV